MNKKADIIRVYLPPDANTLLCVTDCCLRSRHLVNVIVAGKNDQPQWLAMDAAIKHCAAGIGIFEWASSDAGGEPDVVMAAAGDVPTLEMLAAVDLLRQHLPDLKMRVVNVVDLMTLQPREEHPHGLADREFDGLFTTDRSFRLPRLPWLIHWSRIMQQSQESRAAMKKARPRRHSWRATISDRYLVADVTDRVQARLQGRPFEAHMRDKLINRQYISAGQDMPEIR